MLVARTSLTANLEASRHENYKQKLLFFLEKELTNVFLKSFRAQKVWFQINDFETNNFMNFSNDLNQCCSG